MLPTEQNVTCQMYLLHQQQQAKMTITKASALMVVLATNSIKNLEFYRYGYRPQHTMQHNATQRNASQLNTTTTQPQHNHNTTTTQHNAMQCNATQRNAMQRNATQPNATQPNGTQRNATQRNATQRNATQCNAMQRNATQCNATQHNATQRNATQRNATQRNATQHKENELLQLPLPYPDPVALLSLSWLGLQLSVLQNLGAMEPHKCAQGLSRCHWHCALHLLSP